MIIGYNTSAEEYYRLTGTLDARRIEELLDLEAKGKASVSLALKQLINDRPCLEDYLQDIKDVEEMLEEIDLPEEYVEQVGRAVDALYKLRDELGRAIEESNSIISSACYDLQNGFDLD